MKMKHTINLADTLSHRPDALQSLSITGTDCHWHAPVIDRLCSASGRCDSVSARLMVCFMRAAVP
jgi:hypothetical protein